MVLDKSWNETTIEYGHKGVTVFHVLAILSGIVNCSLNSLIWLAFARTPKLLTKSHLYLFYSFAITNSFTGFFTIPTYVNLFVHNNLNCPRWTILIGSSFEIALDKVRAVLTLAIAIERIHALWKPGDYFFLDHQKVASRVCLFAILWGLFDVVFLVAEDDVFQIRIHCVTTSSSGPIFHWYFLISTIVFGLLLAFLYFLFICKLFVMKGTTVFQYRSICRDNFNQVNSLTVMVILMVLIFSVLPCCLYLYDMIVGQVVFMKWGPIITIGYHCYGILSFFFYNYKHREIRSALNKFYPLKRWLNCDQTESHSKSIEAASGSQMSRQIVQNVIKFDSNDKDIISSSTKEASDLSKDEVFL